MSRLFWSGYVGGLIVFLGVCSGSTVYGQSLSPGNALSPGLRVESNRYIQSVIYRPSTAEYQFWGGDRFDLIYETGTEEMARRTKAALLSSWPGTESMVGPVYDGFHTPVIINGYDDQGGGFVRGFPFYQEMDAVSSSSDELVARSSTWPALVAPHELVHSAHVDVQPSWSLAQIIRPFAPDWARGLNGLFPYGAGEGAAVYRESQLEEGAGRLNEPLFTMKMKAAMLSDDPWSFTQMLEPSAYTRPFNRHYIGGAHAFEYLAERGDTTSTEFFQTALTWQNRIPFLGLGPWLGVGAGQFPHQISSEIQTQLRASYATEQEQRRPFTPTTLIAGDEGLNHRRPYWLDDETLVAYVQGYDVRSGFYRIDATTGHRSPIRIQTMTRDRRYSLGRDTTALYASRYVTNPVAWSQEIAEVERVSLQSGEVTRLTDHGRALAPVEVRDGEVHAAKNDGPFTRWAVVEGDTTRPLTPSEPTSIRQIAPAPESGPIAVLKNVGGDQRLYRADLTGGDAPQMEPWLGLKDAIIYDVSWGPEGRYLLFAADHPDAVNIFAFDTKTSRVLQLATVPFGALEPTLSPDRSTVAFVSYRHERHDLVRMPFRPDSASVLPDSVVQLGGPAPSPPSSPSVSLPEEEIRSYSAWRHLAPRAVYPTLRGRMSEWDRYIGPEAHPLAPGLEVTGTDPLRQWAYRGLAYWQDGRFWGEARVESGRYLLRPSLTAYNRSAVPSADTLGLEERGVGMALRLPLLLQSNVYQSSLQLELETQYRQVRLYGGGLEALTPFSSRLTLVPRVGIGYRLQRNPRDLIPNTGVALGVAGKYDPWIEEQGPQLQPQRAVRSELSVYLPFLRHTHTGLRFGVGVLAQNEPSFNTSTFVPRGYEALSNGEDGTFLRFDAEILQPLWYIDQGLTVIPFYANVLSVYGFGQSFGPASSDGWSRTRTSVGGGLSLRLRLFYRFGLDLRVGAAYRVEPGDVRPVFR